MTTKQLVCRDLVREGERRDSNPRPPGPQPGAQPQQTATEIAPAMSAIQVVTASRLGVYQASAPEHNPG
jgi:hypothetical protein